MTDKSFGGFFLRFQGGQCREPTVAVYICRGHPEALGQWGVPVEVPRAVGGQPQCAAEPGRGASGCAGLRAVLQSHRVLRTEGRNATAGLAESPDRALPSLSVRFEFCFPLVYAEALCSAYSALPYLAMINDKLLKIKG